MTQEEAFVQAFIAPPGSDRYLELLRTPRGRAQFRARLARALEFDRRLARPVVGAESSAQRIEQLLRAFGAGDTCYCISERDDLDARELPLGEALALTVGYGTGTLLCCVPGSLAYYEAEDKGRRFILHRAAV